MVFKVLVLCNNYVFHKLFSIISKYFSGNPIRFKSMSSLYSSITASTVWIKDFLLLSSGNLFNKTSVYANNELFFISGCFLKNNDVNFAGESNPYYTSLLHVHIYFVIPTNNEDDSLMYPFQHQPYER